jgi:hypothetical protein
MEPVLVPFMVQSLGCSYCAVVEGPGTPFDAIRHSAPSPLFNPRRKRMMLTAEHYIETFRVARQIVADPKLISSDLWT